MSKTRIPNKLRAEIINRDNKKCLWCGRSSVHGVQLEIDHIISENFGGLTTNENLGTLCNECNNGKSSDYYGNYLLMTLIEIPELNKEILLENFDNHMTIKFKYSLTFFKEIQGYFSKKVIYHIFDMDRFLVSCDKDDTAMIKLDLEKEKNLLIFKNNIKNFLIENKGYFRKLNERIIFQKNK